MIDQRFYEALGPLTVRALAPGADVGGDQDRMVRSAAPAERAGDGDICYYAPRGSKPLATAPAACIIQPALAHLAANAGALVLSENPRATFARIVPALIRPRAFVGDAAIHPSARIEEGAQLCPGVVVGADAFIGAGAFLGPNSVIGPGVAIGRRTRIGACVSIAFALIGDDVSILSGAVIGEQGFGIAGDASGPIDVPHLGRVVIQDRVTIGANTTIDRGVFDDTTIAEGAKIDNLCQIAHNVSIGRGAILAAFAGISGSVQIGDAATLAGRVGVGDHRKIGAGATLAGAAAVGDDVPPGEVWMGYPAKPIRTFLREVRWVARKAAGGRDAEK
ncbi:MAG: UDP-3-O-(3-hydroxymyristoyl)glucosamine N-acyltransferase [Proteobacteria bacterium]|nr:UDP-3-O-(3-hydroxymyristoyl)glucosamine N-acyltransferase [Pseudomonadota bacterium]